MIQNCNFNQFDVTGHFHKILAVFIKNLQNYSNRIFQKSGTRSWHSESRQITFTRRKSHTTSTTLNRESREHLIFLNLTQK